MVRWRILISGRMQCNWCGIWLVGTKRRNRAGAWLCAALLSANRLMVYQRQASEAVMTNEHGRRRRVSDEHDHLARIYRTVWWGKTRGMVTTRFVHRCDRLLGLI